jgi:hypothetical protein
MYDYKVIYISMYMPKSNWSNAGGAGSRIAGGIVYTYIQVHTYIYIKYIQAYIYT